MKKVSILIILLAILIIPLFCFADLGRKPSMEFYFVLETSEPISIIEGKQIQCEDKDCLTSAPLREMGPQRFICEEKKCRSVAYHYSPYQKLEIKFSDRIRESNVFKARAVYAGFNVTVTDTGLIVKEKILNPFSFYVFSNFINALLITLVIELFVALIFLLSAKRSKKILISVIIANIISLPLMWFIFPLIKFLYSAGIIIIIIFEAYFIFLLNKQRISLGKCFALSFIINIISFLAGLGF